MAPSLAERSVKVQRWQSKLASVRSQQSESRALYEKIKSAVPSSQLAKEAQRNLGRELLDEAESYTSAVKYYEERIREYSELYDLELVSVGEPAASTNQYGNGVTKSSPLGAASSRS